MSDNIEDYYKMSFTDFAFKHFSNDVKNFTRDEFEHYVDRLSRAHNDKALDAPYSSITERWARSNKHLAHYMIYLLAKMKENGEQGVASSYDLVDVLDILMKSCFYSNNMIHTVKMKTPHPHTGDYFHYRVGPESPLERFVKKHREINRFTLVRHGSEDPKIATLDTEKLSSVILDPSIRDVTTGLQKGFVTCTFKGRKSPELVSDYLLTFATSEAYREKVKKLLETSEKAKDPSSRYRAVLPIRSSLTLELPYWLDYLETGEDLDYFLEFGKTLKGQGCRFKSQHMELQAHLEKMEALEGRSFREVIKNKIHMNLAKSYLEIVGPSEEASTPFTLGRKLEAEAAQLNKEQEPESS